MVLSSIVAVTSFFFLFLAVPVRCNDDEFRCASGQCIASNDICFSGSRDGEHVGCYDNSHLLNCCKCSRGHDDK